MDRKLNGHIFVMKSSVDTNKMSLKNKKNNNELNNKLNRNDFDMEDFRIIINQFLVHYQNSSPENMDSKNSHNPTTAFLANKKALPLEGEEKVACGFSNMISAHQNSMNSSSRQN